MRRLKSLGKNAGLVNEFAENMALVTILAKSDIGPTHSDVTKCHRGNMRPAAIAVFMIPSFWFNAKSHRIVGAALIEDKHTMASRLWIPSA
jgi:hypothetical protein